MILPFWKDKKGAIAAADFSKLNPLLQGLLETQDFKASEGEVVYLYAQGLPEKRLVLLGLGTKEKVTTEKLRRAYANISKSCHQRKIKEINLIFPQIPSFSEEALARGVSEGLLLANYAFIKNKHDSIKEDKPALLEKVNFVGGSGTSTETAKKYKKIAEAVYFARDLVNGNADDVTPQHLSQIAKDLAKHHGLIKTTVFDKKRIEKEKMGLLLAVNRGSSLEPAFIIMEYKGNPKSKDVTVVLGKGITYDTGGLNLKPTGSMETMRCDMGGAATVMGTLMAVAALGLKVNVTGVIASTENCIDAHSYKPGDVYQSHAGKTVEIGNTDAEGRLVLADALSYITKQLKPSRIIDFATLTGAIEVALGSVNTGLMSNDDALADSLIRAGSDTYERLWRMPLHEEYRDQLKSDVADIKNVGGRGGGAITAAIFLQEFVDKCPWAHCDIAATAFLSENKFYHPKLGTGIGVRLMVDFLEHL